MPSCHVDGSIPSPKKQYTIRGNIQGLVVIGVLEQTVSLFSLSTQINGNFMISEQSMLLWKQKSHIQIRGSEHLVLCYSARYQMLHCHRFMLSIIQCSFTSFIVLPLGKFSDTTKHITSEHQEAIQKSPKPLTIKYMTFFGGANHAWIPHYAYKT